MKTLTAYLTDTKTNPLLYDELSSIIKRYPQHENDYVFFYTGRIISKSIQSKSYKWKKIFIDAGYKITGEYQILRRSVPFIEGYEHAAHAGVIFLSKHEHKQNVKTGI